MFLWGKLPAVISENLQEGVFMCVHLCVCVCVVILVCVVKYYYSLTGTLKQQTSKVWAILLQDET